MINFYLETSAVQHFLKTMNGIDAKATREYQLEKGHDWYISIPTLWEVMQINDDSEYDFQSYVLTFLVNSSLLKSTSEIVIDYINHRCRKYQSISSLYSNSEIAKCWEKACNNRGYTFGIKSSLLLDRTKKIKDISKIGRASCRERV